MPLAATIATTYPPKEARGKGANLLLLFSLPVNSKVLVIGGELEGWSGVFDDCHFCQDMIPAADTTHRYDMVLYHSGCASSRRQLNLQLKIISSLVRNDGVALFFGRNFFSIATLMKFKEGNLDRLHNQLCIGYKGLSRAVEAIKSPYRRKFLVLPSLENGDEFVGIGSRYLEIPHYWHYLYHIAHRTCGYQFVSDGSLFVNLPHAIEEGMLMHAVATHLAAALEINQLDIHLERFDLRLRGAMVLFVTVGRMGQRYVVRLVSDRKSQVIVSRNQNFLEKLHSLPDVERDIGDLLPRPFCQFFYEGCIVFIESLIVGVPAWKINSLEVRKQIFFDASQFLIQLLTSTTSLVCINDEKIGQIYEVDLKCLKKIAPNFLYSKISYNIHKIKSILLGRNIFLVFSHGDYGYGNILVDSKTGILTGVIDWDTGRTEDLPGIDYMNLLVHKCISENGCGLAGAFKKTCGEVLKRGALDENGIFAAEFQLTGDLLNVVLYSYLIRYMSRAAQYPDVFAGELDDYCDCFSFLENSVPL